MRKRITLIVSLLLLATSYCHARALTLAEADTAIMILLFVVILLIVLGGFGLHYNRVITRRNEQLLRILNALDDYRAIVADGALSLDEQENVLKLQQSKSKAAKAVQTDDCQAFYVKMDARVNKEKPFTNPDFNQQLLALRAEYAAKILMEHSDSDYLMYDMAFKCGFYDSASFNSAFKFAFGITPTEYLHSMSQMFKKNEYNNNQE